MQVDGLKGVLDPFWGGSCWFYPSTGMVVGKAEAGAVVVCIPSARQAATRLGVSSAGTCNYCRHRLPFCLKGKEKKRVQSSSAISVCQGVHTRRVRRTSCVRFLIATRLRR